MKETNTIKVGILGYGNLGKGVECALHQNQDMELVGVFSRRNPAQVEPVFQTTTVYSLAQLEEMKTAIDVLILCGGSAADLPEMTPAYAEHFHVVDSFDTHAKIPAHFTAVDQAAKSGGKVAIISVGWDPGMFSVNRVLAEAILPAGENYTFWGKGVSQGHSDAIRKIAGVVDARQYTVPVTDAVNRVRAGEAPLLTTREKHTRLCYVTVEAGVDCAMIEEQIKTMPDYFADYDTTVHFISLAEMQRDHQSLPHGGMVLRSGLTGSAKGNKQVIEYRLQLDSNPEFTASVLVAYARAAARLAVEGQSGCKTVFDIAPAYLINRSGAELRQTFL